MNESLLTIHKFLNITLVNGTAVFVRSVSRPSYCLCVQAAGVANLGCPKTGHLAPSCLSIQPKKGDSPRPSVGDV